MKFLCWIGLHDFEFSQETDMKTFKCFYFRQCRKCFKKQIFIQISGASDQPVWGDL